MDPVNAQYPSLANDALHPCLIAQQIPDHPAMIKAETGTVTTYAEMDARSNQVAHLVRRLGLGAGSAVAIATGPTPDYFEICWAAQRAGLYYVPLNYHATPAEADYIFEDSGAELVFLGAEHRGLVTDRDRSNDRLQIMSIDFEDESALNFVKLRDAEPTVPIDDEEAGVDMLYTSGTTGKPKGVRRPLTGMNIAYARSSEPFYRRLGVGPDTVYLAAGPLYHTSPLHTCMQVMSRGATCILIDRFDAEAVLAAIERYRITHVNFVPTHFVRLLRLPETVRQRYDLRSLRVVMHGAAPCPVEVKQRMIDWFGPIITEFYGGTEAMGGCSIEASEWLNHKGSVGRTNRGAIHIVDEATGAELGPGSDGLVYFEDPPRVRYHNDVQRTEGLYSKEGWGTLGDIGHLDADGYLYLVDRRSNLIITGGVNVYPQEAENRLILHPLVDDAAVFGVPSEEFGEEVCGVVVPAEWPSDEMSLERELISFCKAELSSVKCPRSITFAPSLPRGENGKLYKKLVREQAVASRRPCLDAIGEHLAGG